MNSTSRMPVHELKTHTTPINKVSARVAFFRGEHFQPASREGAPKNRKKTMLGPPDPYGDRPAHADDLTGQRAGRMTFLYWYLQDRGCKQVWVARCDCGRYELRNASEAKAADMHRRWRDEDCCERCKDDLVATQRSAGNSRPSAATRTERTKTWVAGLLAVGLTAREIEAIHRAPNAGIRTTGQTAEQIRSQLASMPA